MSAPCLPVPRHKKKRKRNHGSNSYGHEDAAQDPRRNNEESGDEDDYDDDEEETFDDIQTMDASEYLSRVVNQAKKLPEIFVSQSSSNPADHDNKNAIPKRYRDHVPIDGSAASLSYLVSGRASLTRPPSQEYLPKLPNEWVKATLDNFEKLRDYMEECRSEGIGGKLTDRISLPPMKDRSGWHMFCMGGDEANGNINSYFGEEYIGADNTDKDTEPVLPQWQRDIPADGHAPSVRLLAQMDQVLVRRVLSHLCHYTNQGWKLTPQRSAWLYALLARLEKPVHRDDASTLFALLKVLTRCRSKVDVQSGHRSNELAYLNVLIVLIGIYFEQGANIVMSVR